MNISRATSAFFHIAALLAAVGILYSQANSIISGTVRDTSGAVVSGAKIVATDVDRGTTMNTTTNEAGRYAFPNLGVGKYVVSAENKGFKKSSTQPITIDVNQAVEVNIAVEVGAVTEQVEVTAAAPLLQANDSQVGGLVENKEINDLPLAARDFMQLALLAPGVVDSTNNSRHQTERATWIGSFVVHGIPATYDAVGTGHLDG